MLFITLGSYKFPRKTKHNKLSTEIETEPPMPLKKGSPDFIVCYIILQGDT